MIKRYSEIFTSTRQTTESEIQMLRNPAALLMNI
jgi:hypothetical protein